MVKQWINYRNRQFPLTYSRNSRMPQESLGLTHERTGPDRMLLGMILDELMGQGMMIDQGYIADSMLRAGFKSVRSQTMDTDWGPWILILAGSRRGGL